VDWEARLAMSENCIFCALDHLQIQFENESMIAFNDRYPVTEGHHLIVPKRHRVDFFELTEQEHLDARSLLLDIRSALCSNDPTIDGFNIGMNCGRTAGQTVFHCHIHLIPRRQGDVDDPTGGVRGVIPAKQRY